MECIPILLHCIQCLLTTERLEYCGCTLHTAVLWLTVETLDSLQTFVSSNFCFANWNFMNIFLAISSCTNSWSEHVLDRYCALIFHKAYQTTLYQIAGALIIRVIQMWKHSNWRNNFGNFVSYRAFGNYLATLPVLAKVLSCCVLHLGFTI